MRDTSALAGSYLWPRWVFLRALGLIFLSAFYSLAFQIHGLIGERGILPARDYLQQVHTVLGGARAGVGDYVWAIPVRSRCDRRSGYRSIVWLTSIMNANHTTFSRRAGREAGWAPSVPVAGADRNERRQGLSGCYDSAARRLYGRSWRSRGRPPAKFDASRA